MTIEYPTTLHRSSYDVLIYKQYLVIEIHLKKTYLARGDLDLRRWFQSTSAQNGT